MDGGTNRLEDENDALRKQLSAANRDIARLLAINAVIERQLQVAGKRLMEKDMALARLEASLDGEEEEGELPFDARRDLGERVL